MMKWGEREVLFLLFGDEEQIVDLLPFVVVYKHTNGKTINFRCNAAILEFAKEISRQSVAVVMILLTDGTGD